MRIKKLILILFITLFSKNLLAVDIIRAGILIPFSIIGYAIDCGSAKDIDPSVVGKEYENSSLSTVKSIATKKNNEKIILEGAISDELDLPSIRIFNRDFIFKDKTAELRILLTDEVVCKHKQGQPIKGDKIRIYGRINKTDDYLVLIVDYLVYTDPRRGLKDGEYNNFEEKLKMAEAGNARAQYDMAQTYENGDKANNINKNLAKAFDWYLKAAENGNSKSQFTVASIYGNNYKENFNKLVKKDLNKAFNWYEKAANQENIGAIYNLALFYLEGRGIKKNPEKAKFYLEKIVRNNLRDSEDNEKDYPLLATETLAYMYYHGEGIKEDKKEALKLYERAAYNGSAEGNFIAALHYDEGDIFEQDYEKAFYLYQKAATVNYIDAQFNLALMYEEGRGTKKDLKQAKYWYKKACDNGDTEACQAYKNIK